MASGKQLSFQYGEVDPTLRFRSDDMSYAEGLGKLRNMYVRRSGGVSNRAGFLFVKKALTQEGIPTLGENPGVRAFNFWNYKTATWDTFEYALYPTFDGYGFSHNGAAAVTALGESGTPTFSVTGPTPLQIRFTQLKDEVLITPPTSAEYISGVVADPDPTNTYYDIVDGIFNAGLGADDLTLDLTPGALQITEVTTGTVVSTPASYLVMANFHDGTEEVIAESGNYSGISSGSNYTVFGVSGSTISAPSIKYPNSTVYNNLYWAFTGPDLSRVKTLSLYHCAGNLPLGDKGYYKLCGRAIVSSQATVGPVTGSGSASSNNVTFTAHGVTTGMAVRRVSGTLTGFSAASQYYAIVVNANTLAFAISYEGAIAGTKLTVSGANSLVLEFDPVFTFSDFGADEAASTPSIDDSMINTGSGFQGLRGVVSAAYYQQRLIGAMDPGVGDFRPGDLIASKLGAPAQVRAPIIYSNNGAFQFSTPVTDGTPAIATLAMERLIAFTSRAVYVIRGGEQGILTPTTINPLKISEEGCSSVVEPKMSGRRGYFINASHTKLMGIQFGVDGNLEVFDASVYSDHFLLEDVCQLEVIGGKENTVFLLRRDGKMVQITASESGVHGYSLIETDGIIESIYRGKALKFWQPNSLTPSIYYDVLMAYVIRNGYRSLEKIELRDDTSRMGEMFADCAATFGSRLQFAGADGYYRIGDLSASQCYTNIGDGSTPSWATGDTITITSSDSNMEFAERVFFYYDDADGVEQTLEFVPDLGTFTDDGFGVYTVDGTFTTDVPASLRNVDGQTGLTTVEKNLIKSRYLPGVSSVFLSAAHRDVLGATGSNEVALQVSGDGTVVSSPNNPNEAAPITITSASTSFNLGGYYAYGHFGLPYISEFETMDLESSGPRTLTDAKKLINQVGIGFHQSRGGFYGMPDVTIDKMTEVYPRTSDNASVLNENMNGHIEVAIPAHYTGSGRVNIKHVDPTPLTILAVFPKGIAGD